ncbi:MAG: nucleotidyltransferase family protein [Candidatus Hydrogenedentota bacterium]
MNTAIESRREQLAELCRRFHVKQLELFGSAAREAFDAETSDLDFLVEFEPCAPADHYERYFGLLEGLEALLEKPVDLVETQAITNPYFLRRVNETRTSIYAA